MRKWLFRICMLAAIGIAAYSVESKLDFFPAIAQSGDHTTLLSLEQKLAEHFQNHDESFSLTFIGDKNELADQLSEVIRAALRRDDYSAYILHSYVYTIRSWGNQSTISIEAKYRETREQTASVAAHAAKTIAEIIKPAMNDHEKVKAIHDWVVSKVEYDQSLTNYTAYSALTTGLAVCQGYSLLTYKLMKEAGIPVLIAEGSVNTGEHAWNMIELDGVWYHLDTTWDDPVIRNSDGTVASALGDNAADKPIRYNYYLKSDEELRADHQWTRQYPEASTSYASVITELSQNGADAEENERFVRLKQQLGLHWLDSKYTVENTSALRKVIQAALAERETALQFRYLPGEAGFSVSLREAFNGTNVAVGYRVSYETISPDGSLMVSIQLDYDVAAIEGA